MTETTSAPPKAAPAEERLAPAEHAKQTGNVQPFHGLAVNGERATERFSWQHAAAAQLHGWAEHEHHEGGPILLTRAEYAAALKAASEPVTRVLDDKGRPAAALNAKALAELKGKKPTRTTYEPHEGALSKHAACAKEA